MIVHVRYQIVGEYNHSHQIINFNWISTAIRPPTPSHVNVKWKVVEEINKTTKQRLYTLKMCRNWERERER